jgi:hypothetical protein
MLCSRHKYIFIHVSKTAGTSIERTLQPDTPLDAGTRAYGNTDFEEKHWSAEVYKDHYPQVFGKYFKFAFVRNPWDRLVSNYNWHLKAGMYTGLSFKEWILTEVFTSISKYSYKRMIATKDGKILVDFVGRFENLKNDYQEVCNRLGLEAIPLIHANNLSDRPHYTEYYSKDMQRRVYDAFSWDIQMFNYTF